MKEATTGSEYLPDNRELGIEIPNPLRCFSECPLCGSSIIPEHAHFKCAKCGWRDSCCD